MSRKVKVAACASALVLVALILSCSEDSNYDQRAVIYVSSINGDAPYLCDVLNQGDSLYMPDNITYKTSDDFITEDRIEIAFTNKPYNSIIDPENGSLGDFLVTGYDVRFFPYGGASEPVQRFTGSTSILVPSGETVSGEILLVPFAAKTVDPLVGLEYSALEIMARAHITFHGHEIQTNNELSFEVNMTVNFADPLTTKKDQQGQ
jgi:hypothetical protein